MSLRYKEMELVSLPVDRSRDRHNGSGEPDKSVNRQWLSNSADNIDS